MTETDTLMGLIRKMVIPLFKYAVPRIGKVVDRDDQSGRVLVVIPSLGWDTKEKGTWCAPTELKGLKVPEKESYVLVEWIDMNPDIPIYRGIPGGLKDQIPESYSGDPTENILFQGGTEDIIRFKEGLLEILMKELVVRSDSVAIGNDAGKGAARLDDTTISNSETDSAFWTLVSAFFGVVTGPAIPEPGNGSPSAFQTALALAVTSSGGAPSKIDGKINSSSEKVVIG